MKKRLFVEVIEFSRLRKNNFLVAFLCLVFSPTLMFPQIERNPEKITLNGFGRYIFIGNQVALQSLFTYDCDGDGFVDIGGLDKSGKNLFIYYGKAFNKFEGPIKYSFGQRYSGVLVRKLNIDSKSNLILFSKLDGILNIYSFINRSITRVMSIKGDCCFSDLNVVDLDSKPELEIVLSGSNFKGIGIISFHQYTYNYKRIGQEFYSKLLPIFLNSDKKMDFVGVDAFSRELVLLRNNSLYNYSKNVYTKFDESIDEVLSGNFDDDLLKDIAVISNESKKIYFLFGNGIGSFRSKMDLKIVSNYTNSLSFDYNKDLIDNIITYDKFNKKLYLKSISIEQKKLLSHPIIEIQKLYSLSTYRTITTKGIAVSSDEGIFLLVYSNLNYLQGKFALISSPADLVTLRLTDEIYPRIFVIDKENRRLNIISRNEFNSPQEIFSYPLSYGYEKLKVLSNSENEISLVCYKPLIYHFDYLRIDLKSGRYLKENLSVNGLIEDIGMEAQLADKEILNVITISGSELRSVLVKPFEANKVLLMEKLASSDVIDFVFDFSTRELFFIDKDLSKFELRLWIRKFDQSYKKYEDYRLISLRDENYLTVNLSLCDLYKDSRIAFVNASNLKESKLFIFPVSHPDKNFVIDKIKITDLMGCKCQNHTGSRTKTFSFYNEASQSIEQIIFSSKGKPVNYPIKKLPSGTIYSIDYSLKQKPEIVYISDYSIINIEQIAE